jgi:hypothetical protein
MNDLTARWNKITKTAEMNEVIWNATTTVEQNILETRAAHKRNAQVNEWRKLVRSN